MNQFDDGIAMCYGIMLYCWWDKSTATTIQGISYMM